MDSIEKIFYMFIASLVVYILVCAVLAHCFEPSKQTDQETLSLYIKKCNPHLDRPTRRLIAEEIVCQSHNAGVPWEVIAAIAKVESYYDPLAIGPLGEIGIMQVYTMECSGLKLDPTLLPDIGYNITAGICIFLEKLRVVDGDFQKAIMLYNGTGPKAVEFRERVYAVIFDIFRFRVADLRDGEMANARDM